MGGLNGKFWSNASCMRFVGFQSKDDDFNILGTKFWHENVKFYELQQIMQQNIMQLIFWINFEQHKHFKRIFLSINHA